MAHLIPLTQEMVFKALSVKGTLTAAQFRALGYSGPFKGWKKKLIGKLHDPGDISQFMALKAKKGQSRGKKKVPKDIYEHPRWKEKRARIYKRDENRCVECGRGPRDGVKINAHHLLYIKEKEIWEVPDWYLVTLCDGCHKKEHSKRLSPPSKHF